MAINVIDMNERLAALEVKVYNDSDVQRVANATVKQKLGNMEFRLLKLERWGHCPMPEPEPESKAACYVWRSDVQTVVIHDTGDGWEVEGGGRASPTAYECAVDVVSELCRTAALDVCNFADRNRSRMRAFAEELVRLAKERNLNGWREAMTNP